MTDYRNATTTAEELRERMRHAALATALEAAKDHRAVVNRAHEEFHGASDETVQYWCKKVLAAGDTLDARLRSCLAFGWTPSEVAEHLRDYLSPVYVEDLLGPSAGW